MMLATNQGDERKPVTVIEVVSLGHVMSTRVYCDEHAHKAQRGLNQGGPTSSWVEDKIGVCDYCSGDK